jgi:hypothetical protein
MKSLTFAPATLLLLAVCSGPALADEPGRLPDLSGALQARIDGRMSAVLDAKPAGKPAPAPVSASRPSADRADAVAERRPLRTDESGWKPYHSAM